MATYLENLRTARNAIAAELAELDSTKAGGKPDHSGSGIGHTAYFQSRLDALAKLDERIAAAELSAEDGGGGPFEVIHEVE